MQLIIFKMSAIKNSDIKVDGLKINIFRQPTFMLAHHDCQWR